MAETNDSLFGQTVGTEFEAADDSIALSRQRPPPDTAIAGLPCPIQSLTLRNFKTFESFEISLRPFNVLVGANNSGKSTVLRALRFGYELTRLHFDRVRDGRASFFPGRSVPRSLLPVAQLRDLWTGGRLRRGNTWIPSQVGITLEGGYVLRFGVIGPWNAATSRIAKDDHERMNEIPPAVIERFLSRPPELVPASIGIVAEEEYRTPARRSALVSSGRHNEIVRNYVRDLDESQRGELSKLLKRYFGADIAPIDFDEARDQFIPALYTTDEYQHDLYSAGGGFLQIVEVLVFILRGNPGVVLLDEPDSHLHSSLQHALVDILDDLASQKHFQVLMATHSKEIINYVDPSRLIYLEAGASTASPMQAHAGTVTILKEIGTIDNVDAYQIVRQKVLLVVEGPTDRELLPRLASRAGSDVFLGAGRVSIVPGRGVERLQNEVQLNILKEILGKTVRCMFLRDRDAMSDEWKARLETESAHPTYIWDYDCLESYLIVASPIHAILVEELGTENAPSLADVQGLIDEVVDSFRDAAVDRVAARIQDLEWQHNHERVDSAYANPIARAEIEKHWVTTSTKLRFVGGKEALRLLRQRIQNEYAISFGNMRIVEKMVADDLDPAITMLLEKVTETLLD